MATGALEWLTRYAAELGTDPPSEPEIETLLALAGEAAHASERMAAPIACWLTARAGVAPQRALELARQLAQTPP